MSGLSKYFIESSFCNREKRTGFVMHRCFYTLQRLEKPHCPVVVLHLAYKPVLSPNISPSVAPLSYTDNPLIMLPFQVQHRLSVLGFQIRSDKSLLFIIIQCIKTKTKQKQRSLTHRLKNKYVKVSPTLPLLSLSYILTPHPPNLPPHTHTSRPSTAWG